MRCFISDTKMKRTEITSAALTVTSSKWLHIVWPEVCANEPVTAVHREFLKKIEGDVVAIDPTVKPDGDVFRTALLVVAGGMVVGPFPNRLIQLTGFPPAMVNDVCLNMRSSGIWKEFAIDAEWIDEEGYRNTALWCHVLVASGLCTAIWDSEQGAWAYQAAVTVA